MATLTVIILQIVRVLVSGSTVRGPHAIYDDYRKVLYTNVWPQLLWPSTLLFGILELKVYLDPVCLILSIWQGAAPSSHE